MTTGLVWHEKFAWYDFGSSAHALSDNEFIQPGTVVESPESKRRIVNLLDALGLLEQLRRVKPEIATRDDLLRVHSEAYIDRVEQLSRDSGGFPGPGVTLPKHGYEIAALSAGGAKSAIEAVLDRRVDNAYAVVRPPGHHAERDTGMSLCVFNNIAVAVEAAIQRGLVNRVAIVDWDAHHGNGTESIFYHRSDVLTLSIHQDQMIPGRGLVGHRGEGDGTGFNVNIPLPPGCGTGAYLAAMERVIVPKLQWFRPDLIVVASGLDASMNDPTARMLLTPESYRQMARVIKRAAQALCEGRLVMVHEGGYEPTAAPFCALAIIEEMSGIKSRIPAGGDPFETSFGALTSAYQPLQEHQARFIERAQEAALKGGGPSGVQSSRD